MKIEPDPVEKIDELLDSVLVRPPMHGCDTIQGLESMIMALLGLRSVWAPLPEAKVPWKTVYGEWTAEYFCDTSPNALAAFARLSKKFGWKLGHLSEDHPETWPKALEFYKELVRRERAAAAEAASPP